MEKKISELIELNEKLFDFIERWHQHTCVEGSGQIRQMPEGSFGNKAQELLKLRDKNLSIVSEDKTKEIEVLAQDYLGMLPRDKGCTNWSEMQKKFVADILKIIGK